LLIEIGEAAMEDYGRRIILDIPFGRGVKETLKAFQAEGFDLISALDLRDYLARHAHHECRRYILFAALLAPFTLEALQHDPAIGPMLTTTIAVYELADGETAISASPALAAVAFDFGWRDGSPAIGRLADRASERVARSFERLHRLGVQTPRQVPA
jgi:uncharacterized protein (DUF302 family)